MATRRMFSKHIVDTDAFIDMPPTSQLLYFHLAMRADDEGFVGSPKKIMRMCGFQDDDLKILIAKRFILTFNTGVVVIKHWLIHNTIRMDRFCPTTYQTEKKQLKKSKNKAYTEIGKPNGNQLETQVKLSKDKLSKVKTSKGNATSEQSSRINELINLFEPINPSYERLYPNKSQRAALERMLAKFGFKKLAATIQMLPLIINKKFAPRATTPVTLENKLGDILAFYKQEESNKPKVTII